MDFEQAMTEPCPSCGTRDEEWRDPKTFARHYPPPYEAEGLLCLGCAELTRGRKELEARYSDGNIEPGVRVVLRRYKPSASEDEGED
jgi:hypothetical protein